MMLAALTLRFLLAWLLLTVGWSKLPRWSEFRRAVRRYELLPERLIGPAAIALVVLEIGAGILLAAGLALRPVAAATGAMLLVYAGAMSVNVIRGRKIDCGCASTPHDISWPLILRNIALAIAAGVLAFNGATSLSVDQLLGAGVDGATDTSVAVVIATVCGYALVALTVQAWQLRRYLLTARGARI